MQAIRPVPDEVIAMAWYENCASADSNVFGELQMANSEQQGRFKVTDILTLQEIMDAHTGSRPITTSVQMTVQSSAIEESSFKLNMTQMEYDFQAWKVFDSKMDSLQTAIAHTKLQWRLQARAENEEAVKKVDGWLYAADAL